MKTAVPTSSIFGVLLSIFLMQFTNTSFSQNIDFGKSYINVTKGTNGGTVEPGDILEIRSSIVVRTGTYDSCAYFDIVPAGTTYMPGTIRVLTNEGKIYKQFTDALGDDQGSVSSGNIRINLGYNPSAAPSTASKRGRISSTHYPSFYGSACIMIASFRVQVNSGYGSTISIGGGSMSYKFSAAVSSFTFPARTIAVYKNVGICPNAVGANAIGTEFNGTFGSGKKRNRGNSANVPTGYTYNVVTGNSPNDYYYGIPNNTSIINGYATHNNYPKPDNSKSVFGVWDIIGDHTGATNQLTGNSAADTSVNPNAGYMLVINAAYRIDSAFQQTISNLCPNTYYEISLWLRNICSRCGCDSLGRGAGTAGYIPTAPNDSSGVYPNLSFNVDGIDYYSTGNLLYTGQWVKKGFTFQTGPSQTSFTLKVFNNAPGGGGNDWALDDISVATCSPNLYFTPNNNPTVCVGNTVDLGAYIRSYFDNYTYFKWQKTVDNGATWNDLGSINNAAPTWTGTDWQYYTAHPTFIATMSDSGTKFRVVVASTASNISNASCSFADVTSILTLNVIDCGMPLSTNFVSFTGKQDNGQHLLNWVVNKESEPLVYEVQRSLDGRIFTTVAKMNGNNNNEETNYYKWAEPVTDEITVYYRIKLSGTNNQKLSRIIKIAATKDHSDFINVLNPFNSQLTAEFYSSVSQNVQLQLVDISGRLARRQQFNLMEGMNTLLLENLESLPKGLYTLRLSVNGKVFIKKILKQ